jgi:hypothetical protein
MATPNVNIPPGWRIRMFRISQHPDVLKSQFFTVDSEESPSTQGMPPKPKTPVPAALHPEVQMSSGGASELYKYQDSTSLKQKKRHKTKTN